MKKIIAIALALVMALSACAFAATNEEAAAIAASITETTTDKSLSTNPYIEVISQVQDSVLGINNYQNYSYNSFGNGFGYGFGFGYGYGNYRNRNTETVEQLAGTGSGVVIYNEVVLTNYHVVEGATRLTVNTLTDDEELAATLLSYDENEDLAVLYVPGLTLSPVPLGDSDQLQVGEWAICIGNPLMEELRGTVTMGIISALNREISSNTTVTDKYGLKTKITNTLIQTDAAINSGNSGGGLFNVQGQLMGIPSRKYSGATNGNAYIEGIGLAIPINTAKPIIREALVKLLTGDTTEAKQTVSADGETATSNTDKPRLGVTGSMISANNYYLVYAGMLPGGMLISEVTENSPAALAGIQPYDVIVEVDGQIATGINSIRDVLDSHAYGDTIMVKVYRLEGLENAETTDDLGNGQYIDLNVTLFEYDTEA